MGSRVAQHGVLEVRLGVRVSLCPIVGHDALDTLLVEAGGMASEVWALCDARWGHARFTLHELADAKEDWPYFRMVSMTMESISTLEQRIPLGGSATAFPTPTQQTPVGNRTYEKPTVQANLLAASSPHGCHMARNNHRPCGATASGAVSCAPKIEPPVADTGALASRAQGVA